MNASSLPINMRYSRPLFVVICIMLLSFSSLAQVADDTLSARKLKQLSLEELMDIEVTSISNRAEKLTEVASAVQVITGYHIDRSGVKRLPEALRLASNLQISQANSHDWAITARGFNGLPSAGGVLANKLLVMIDGRSVYNPLFGGVYWDVQSVMMEDLDRIEVVSGPGGTLWGANAVNGVINIVSKSADKTQGLYTSVAGGSFMQDWVEARYGFKTGKDSNIFVRVYGQRMDQKNTYLTDADRSNAHDAWNATQGGFRMDYYPSQANILTVQGDFYAGFSNSTSKRINTDGQNVLARFTHIFSEKSELKAQVYFDRTWRHTPNSAAAFFYDLKTYDIDIQHRFPLGQKNSVLYGVSYRLQQDRTARVLVPLNRDMPLYNAFIQDEITFIPEKLKLTIGSKFLHNIYSGFEFQPSARIAVTPSERHTIWAAVSRAVRTPTRFDSDVIASPVKFDSEKVIAYELGYRVKPIDRLLFSFATFFNSYDQLRSIDSNSFSATPALILANSQRAESWGAELSANFQATDWWQLRSGVTYFEKKIWSVRDKVHPVSPEFEGVDPNNYFMLQSIMELPKNFKLDLLCRYVDVIKAATTTKHIPSYFTFAARVAWEHKAFVFSVVGQNLLETHHTETGTTDIKRSIYGRVVCRF